MEANFRSMKLKIIFGIVVIVLISCMNKKETPVTSPSIPIVGTWKLIKGVLIEKNDTAITDYTKGVSFIKVINESHFTFLQHDLEHGKGTSPVFVAGGGSYSLNDSSYTEHLEYCSDRSWEGNDFTFTIKVSNDTLIQSGVEKIEKTGIDRLNVEKYVRLK